MAANNLNQASPPIENFEAPHSFANFPAEFDFAGLHDKVINPSQADTSPIHFDIVESIDVNQEKWDRQPLETQSSASRVDDSQVEEVVLSHHIVQMGTMPQPSSESSHGQRRKRRPSDDAGQEYPATRPYNSMSDPVHRIPPILPHDRVFNIQVGCQTFSLSGASISSDAPSYFSYYFLKQMEETGDEDRPLRTLHIDRDPDLFRDIARHLQGYHVQIRDPEHFVYLFADAQLFQLPKLMSRLFESEIFISVGSQSFKISKNIFNSPGNSPNFFTLGFAVFFSTPDEVFPGLNKGGLLRPPSIVPPTISDRSPEIFAEILHYLRGYPIKIKSPEHRAELIRDCRYYHLRGLEQNLIPHTLSYDISRRRHNITIRLEDVKPSGLSFKLPQQDVSSNSHIPVHYARPYVDTDGIERELILEVGDNQSIICDKFKRVEFVGDTQKRITALYQKIADKLNIPTSTASSSSCEETQDTPILHLDTKFNILLDHQCHIILNGETMLPDQVQGMLKNEDHVWLVTKALWRVQFVWSAARRMALEPHLQVIKMDASVAEYGLNLGREFLN